ncbi:MAG: hypothetical protein EXR20_08795 [Bacteroidetes bacterium]|nr:hypothetical protein [Bacteroidota bacterium]
MDTEPSITDVTLLWLAHVFKHQSELPALAEIITTVGIEKYGMYTDFLLAHTDENGIDWVALAPEQERVFLPALIKITSGMTDLQKQQFMERFQSENQMSTALFMQDAMSPKRKLSATQKRLLLQTAIEVVEITSNAGVDLIKDPNSYIERLETKGNYIRNGTK